MPSWPRYSIREYRIPCSGWAPTSGSTSASAAERSPAVQASWNRRTTARSLSLIRFAFQPSSLSQAIHPPPAVAARTDGGLRGGAQAAERRRGALGLGGSDERPLERGHDALP